VQALDVFTRRPTRASLHAFEQALESRSAVKQAYSRDFRNCLTATAAVGNDAPFPATADGSSISPASTM
jgi:hypothetical protein